MRLIDADLMIANGFKDKTIEVRTEDIIESHEKVVKLLFRDAVDFINKQPTVDAVERKRGRWIKNEGRFGWHCSECKVDNFYAYAWNSETGKNDFQDRYCPSCGAEMRGEANE